MSASNRCLLDANIFIQAHQTYYGLDICPGFWTALLRENAARCVFSIDKIRTELLAIDDELGDWVKNKAPASLFKGTADKEVADVFRELLSWVQAQPQFTPDAKEVFADAADGWLIAYAKVNGHIVVTHEEMAPREENGTHPECMRTIRSGILQYLHNAAGVEGAVRAQARKVKKVKQPMATPGEYKTVQARILA